MSDFTFSTTPQRSRIMAAIRSKGNITTERRMAQILRQNRLSGWRRHANLPGHPDFVFTAYKVAIFVDGCFWHGCPKCYRRPRQNRPYWQEKIARNIARDRKVSRLLRSLGWSVLRFWEHTLKDSDMVAARIRRALKHEESGPSGISS